jgi:hypothetical protein
MIKYTTDQKLDLRYRDMSTSQKTTRYVLATVLMAILLGSAMSVPTFSAYAEKDDDHKKSKKDPDKDKDNDKKECKKGDKHKNGKYKHNCDSDHDFK